LRRSFFSQAAAKTGDNTVRVTVSVNADRSRAVLQIRGCAAQSSRNQHRAGGEDLREEFAMNWMMPGFSSGPIFGLDGQLRFTSLEKNDALLHKIVYQHDSAGKQTGYAIFDASGKLIERTSASLPSASVSP
jgi:hypothetical protein